MSSRKIGRLVAAAFLLLPLAGVAENICQTRCSRAGQNVINDLELRSAYVNTGCQRHTSLTWEQCVQKNRPQATAATASPAQRPQTSRTQQGSSDPAKPQLPEQLAGPGGPPAPTVSSETKPPEGTRTQDPTTAGRPSTSAGAQPDYSLTAVCKENPERCRLGSPTSTGTEQGSPSVNGAPAVAAVTTNPVSSPAPERGPDVSGEFKPVSSPEKDGEDSFLKKHLWRNSFDDAADANKKAAKSCGHGELCEGASKTAGKVSKEQETMADVSRVSDAVGMAAVGATALNELRKKSDQQKSLESVAKVHKAAGAANIAAGATDLGLAGYAWLSQKKRLETERDSVNEQLKKISTAAANDPRFKDQKYRDAFVAELTARKNGIEKELNAAIDKTTTASVQHAKWGAGKLASGLAAAKFAKSATKQADDMKSLRQATQVQAYTGNLYGVGIPPAYQNNNPQVQLTGTASTNTIGNSPVGGNSLPGTGSSSLSSQGLNALQQTASRKGGSAISGGGPGGTGPSSNNSGGASRSPASLHVEVTKGGLSENSSSWGSGSGTPFHGGSGGESSSPGPFGDIMQTILGQQEKAEGQRTPATINDALVGESTMVEAGVVSADSNKTLFDLVKTKHIQMVNRGRLSAEGSK